MERFEYFVFGISDDPRVGVIENLDEKVEEYWLLCEGVRVTEEQFPAGVELDLAKDGGNLLTDFIENIHSVVIVSAKARAIMEAEGLGEELVQFLPITLRNKRGKKVPEPYFIANALLSPECFDWDRSEYKTFPGKRKISSTSLRRLHVLEEKLPDTAKFFRVGELKNRLLIRSDLLKRLKAEGCTGISVYAMGERLP